MHNSLDEGLFPHSNPGDQTYEEMAVVNFTRARARARENILEPFTVPLGIFPTTYP